MKNLLMEILSYIVISRRVKEVHGSMTVESSNMAAKMKKEGKKIYNFGIGEPDFTTPEEEIDFAFQMAKSGHTHYTPSKGVPELREAIINKVKEGKNSSLSADNVIVTPTKMGINIAIMTLCDPGDEVIIPEPYFLSYPEICRLYGVKPIGVESERNFSLNFENIENAITPRTRAIIISNPSNPTGKIFDANSVEKLIEICQDHDIYLITDQIYESLIYEGRMKNILDMDPEMKNTILLSGFSKSYAMTGWRIGYMISNSEVIENSDKVQQHTMTCAPSISQMAALRAMTDEKNPRQMLEIFEKRRSLILQKLSEIEGLDVVPPDGAFYVFPSYDLDISSEDFCRKALTSRGIILIPGIYFGEQGEHHFRISYATDEKTIIEGMNALKEFMKDLRKI
ncbi:pyridoxal phosphate-dependent aminotransferase [Cuniculiplasmataceae archaeon SKW2]